MSIFSTSIEYLQNLWIWKEYFPKVYSSFKTYPYEISLFLKQETDNLELCNQLEKGEVVTTVDLENADSPLDHMRAQFHQFGFLFSFFLVNIVWAEEFQFQDLRNSQILSPHRLSITVSLLKASSPKSKRLLTIY